MPRTVSDPRILNVGGASADELATLALEHGFDTFVIGENVMQKFDADGAPRFAS